MRETRNAQLSIFDFYAEHKESRLLESLSDLLDQHPEALELIEQDFKLKDAKKTGARGLSFESILRCLLLKQILKVSYTKLEFHLSDSPTYRSFTRLRPGQYPKRSSLQSVIRRIQSNTIANINKLFLTSWVDGNEIELSKLRIDSTVVSSNIAPPLDSQLLNDGVRVLSRMMFQCKRKTGIKLRVTDQRKKSKSLAFQIFNAKKTEKDRLYPSLLKCVATTLKQITRSIERVKLECSDKQRCETWVQRAEHFHDLLQLVAAQTHSRVINQVPVHASEKIVSLFEPHTDIIVKGNRETLYGHKINLATQVDGFVTYLNVETGNPCDSTLYQSVLDVYKKDYDVVPTSTVADGGYASQENVTRARACGVVHSVFNKRVNLSYHQMGVKKKTFDALKNFRAGVEGNISELKRAFGMGRALWRGEEGFKAYVWICTLSYNLVRMVRLNST